MTDDVANVLKRALLLDHSGDAYMSKTNDVSSFLIDGWVDLSFIASELSPLFAQAEAAGRERGLREAVEVARSFNRAECYQTFIPLDDIATAIEALLSEKAA